MFIKTFMLRHHYYFISILITFFFLTPSQVIGQQKISQAFLDSLKLSSSPAPATCANDIILYNLRRNPLYKAKEDVMNLEIKNAYRRLLDDTITVPVVVHIINQNPYSISDVQVLAGIKDLNNAFSKSGIYSPSKGADTKIRFCLAKKDPDGGNTTGITRTESYFSDHLNMDNEDSRLKNLIQWDPLRYINIWLITNIDAESYANFSCGAWYRLGVTGYATMPPGGDALDGVVITKFGFVLAHEMGHYLGLYHTFAGGCSNFDCTTNGDMVCDTPPDNTLTPSFGCSNPDNSCNTDTFSNYSNGNFPKDVPDQIANFMDYGNGACSNEFTQGQADRMRAAITTQRSGLLQDECTKPCNENIVALFTRNNPYPLPGDNISFTNYSTGAARYEWSVNGFVQSNDRDFSYTFNDPGKYKVTLKAFNTSSCFASSTDYIIVSCGVTARFYTDKKTIASKTNVYEDSIVFTNTSYNAVSYQWLISNDQGMAEHVESTAANLTYVFPAAATYSIRLVATNGSCADTTGVYTVPVYEPTADGILFNLSLICYQQNQVQVSFCIGDVGFAPLPKNTIINFYDADPASPNAHKLSPTFYLPIELPGGNCYTCMNYILNVPYRSLGKVYAVLNDAGTAIPVVLPNTSLPEKDYVNNITSWEAIKTTVFATICQGENYFGHKTSGTYIDTLASTYTGCDSIRTLSLTVLPVFNTDVTASICEGLDYAGHTTSGTFTDVYKAINGCDSTRILHLTVKPDVLKTIAISICDGENYFGYNSSGTYVDVLRAANGCDSIRTLRLIVKPTISTNITAVICQGENYAGHTRSGTYTDVYTAINGCDSTRTLFLTVNLKRNTTINASICEGKSYKGYTTTGTYINIFKAANGCDSTRILNLTVNPKVRTTINASICDGENYAGHIITGTYTDVYKNINGCDSTRTLFLIVKPNVSTNISATICEPYNYAGHKTTGTYVDICKAANGCDSTRTLQLTVNPQKLTVINAAICQGESYFVQGCFQTKTGTYFDTLRTYLDCDSIIKTNLKVIPLPVPDLGNNRGVCIGSELVLSPGNFASYLWQNGSTESVYIASTVGKYFVVVTDTFGCKASDTMNVLRIDPLPANFLPADSSLCRGNVVPVVLNGFKNYNWSTGSTNNFINITKPGSYKLRVEDKNGCVGADSMKVEFYNCIIIDIPNAFTPNDDFKNDVFKPLIPAPVKNYNMKIWNRWGQLMFETKNYNEGWNGKFKSTPQPAAAYVYTIYFTDIDGKNVKKFGPLVLIR